MKRFQCVIGFLRHPVIHSVLLAVFVVLVALACKGKASGNKSSASSAPVGSPKYRREQATAEVKKRLETIAGFAAQVKQAPSVSRNQPLARSADRRRFVVIAEAFLEDPSREETKEELPLRSDLLSLCKRALGNEVIGEADLEHLEDCAKLEYVAVVRPKRLVPPKVRVATKTFDPGKVEGDVFVFDLPKGTVVGSYAVAATNKDEIERQGGGDEEQWMGSAMRNLATKTNRAVEDLLTKD